MHQNSTVSDGEGEKGILSQYEDHIVTWVDRYRRKGRQWASGTEVGKTAVWELRMHEDLQLWAVHCWQPIRASPG
jgi:hypothetical protein